jgi:cystathionine beta-synthase
MIKNGFSEGVSSSKATTTEKKPAKRTDSEEPIFDFGNHAIKDLKLPEAVTVLATDSCAAAVEIMEKFNFDQVPVVSSKGSGKKNVVGLVTLGNILAKVAHGRAAMTDAVTKVMFRFDKTKSFTEITVDTHLSHLTKFFDHNSAAVVTEKQGDDMIVKHVVTKIDLVKFMAHKQIQQSPKKKQKK